MRQKYAPGELDKRIKFIRKVFAADGMGGNTSQFELVAECWAHVMPARGSERVEFDRLAAVSSSLFVIRSRQGILESYMIEFGGENYNIRSIRRSGNRNLYLEIEAERGVAQ